MANKYTCKCTDPGSCAIDLNIMISYAGIQGLSDIYNCKIDSIKKHIICNNCNKIIYKEKLKTRKFE